MYHRVKHTIVSLLCIMSFSISPSVAFSQSEPEDVTAGNAPALTEVMVEETITLDAAVVTAAAATKTDVQGLEKTITSLSDTSDDSVEKQTLYLPMIQTNGVSVSEVDASAVDASWRTIKFEGFEGVWPNSGWRTYDCNGTANGNYFWDDESWIAASGRWSGWPAGNRLNPATTFYPNNACAWMIYGPFNLSRAQSARLVFNYWNQSELNFDWIGWYASCDGVNFSGFRVSGNSNGWRSVTQSLTGCGRDSTVWIGYKFTSDSSVTDDGPFIDNIYVQEFR